MSIGKGIKIGSKYVFKGPYADTAPLKDQSGVYVILGKNDGDNWTVVDVGESHQLKTRVENHGRKACWEEQDFAKLEFAVLYADEDLRMVIETELRDECNPPCGER